MNKTNSYVPDFEVSRGYRRNQRAGCGGCSAERDRIHGNYSEALSLRGAGQGKEACESDRESRYGLDNRPVGSVYAPLQAFDRLYDTHRALARGTLFSDLDLPLEVGNGGRCNG